MNNIREQAMQAVIELSSQMVTTIKPWRGSDSMAAKYADRTPREGWVIVSFSPVTDTQQALIFEKRDELRNQGIGFDTGSGCGGIHWELDWSLHEIDELSVKRSSNSEPVIPVELPINP